MGKGVKLMSNYIPDMTERFPEGMYGIDMTNAYFGEPVDYSRALRSDYNDGEYDDGYEELMELLEWEKYYYSTRL